MCVCAPDSESVCPSKHVDTDTTHAQRCPDEILGRFPRPVRASSERSYTMDATLFSLGAPKYCWGGVRPACGRGHDILGGRRSKRFGDQMVIWDSHVSCRVRMAQCCHCKLPRQIGRILRPDDPVMREGASLTFPPFDGRRFVVRGEPHTVAPNEPIGITLNDWDLAHIYWNTTVAQRTARNPASSNAMRIDLCRRCSGCTRTRRFSTP